MQTVKYGGNKKASEEALEAFTGASEGLARRQKDEGQSGVEQQRKCLEACRQLLTLEDAFGNLCLDLCEKTVGLTEEVGGADAKNPSALDASHVQRCGQGVRESWSWMSKLLGCSQQLLTNCSDYYQFFHSAKELSAWMPADLAKSEQLLRAEGITKQQQADVVQKLLLELKTAHTIFSGWQTRLSKLVQQGRRVPPLRLRNRPSKLPFLATALASYATKEVEMREGEELEVVDNSMGLEWKVRNVEGSEFQVPCLLLSLSSPDPHALETAVELCLRLLWHWAEAAKRYGRTILLFLLHVFRSWKEEEGKQLRALSDANKTAILALTSSVATTFSPLWDSYPPYAALQKRMHSMHVLLGLPPATTPGEEGSLLVVQTEPLEQLLADFRDFWRQWGAYRVWVATLNHPGLVLLSSRWQELLFADPALCFQKWMQEEHLDWKSFATDDMVEEEIQVESSKQTTEASRLFSSLQEERQTFVITGVTDPNSGEVISMDDAVARGIINQAEGKYLNPLTGESLAIPVAMNAGKIRVEKVSVKTSKERVKDIGLLTLTTIKESRPYLLKGVKSSKSDQVMTPEEATAMGVLEQSQNRLVDPQSGHTMSLADALDCGLLVVEFKTQDKAPEPVIETKTFQVSAVLDSSSGKLLTFSEATQKGILDLEDGSYKDTKRGVDVYVADAIRDGLVKAIVVRDPSKLAEEMREKRVMVSPDRLRHFKRSILNPLKAVNAMKRK